MRRVEGKVALVTGVAGPKGIGYATAKKLASEGAILAVTDISAEVYDRAKEIQSLGYKAVRFKVDCSKSQEVKQMAEKVLQQFGRIDILVNVAGAAPRGEAMVFKRFVDVTEEEWDRDIANNLKTTFNCTKAVLPSMIKQRYGKIVNISSVTGPIVSNPSTAAYSAAKGGVLGLTRALALDVAEYGITVNAIGPGWIATGRAEEIEDRLDPTIPLKRCGKPEEVADLVLFLASEESCYITGHMIVIDGANIIQEFKGEGELF
jgi:3-oxoacyl-[acyl-carrier protein] reductase